MCEIKVYPVAPITAIFPDDVVIEGNKFKYEVTACIYHNGRFFKDDSHFGCCILRLQEELNEEEFEALEENDFSDIDEYEEKYEIGVYGAIYKINNKEVFITFLNSKLENKKKELSEIRNYMDVYYYKDEVPKWITII